MICYYYNILAGNNMWLYIFGREKSIASTNYKPAVSVLSVELHGRIIIFCRWLEYLPP